MIYNVWVKAKKNEGKNKYIASIKTKTSTETRQRQLWSYWNIDHNILFLKRASSTYLLKQNSHFLLIHFFFSVLMPLLSFLFIALFLTFLSIICYIFLCITLFFPVEDPHYNARGMFLILYVRGKGCYFWLVSYLLWVLYVLFLICLLFLYFLWALYVLFLIGLYVLFLIG